MSEGAPDGQTREELLELHRALVGMRDEMADYGRYYLYDPDHAAEHASLTRQIEEVWRKIERLGLPG